MRLALLGGLLLVASCASFTPGNPPLAKYAPDQGYRFERLERGENSDQLFVIVTFSGGGTRAAALGTCQPQLVVHINGALNVGCTEAEVVEIILAVAIFAGFPAAINAMVIAKQVFADRAAGRK